MNQHDSEHITSSFEETKKLGEDFAKSLRGGEIIALYGDLGSGKTTFTQGVARGLGIEKKINSPTFIILRTYRITNYELGIKYLYHIDLYRVESEHDIQGLGLDEIFAQKDAVTVIEWAEKMGSSLPKNHIAIHFTYLDDEKRKIVITQ